ncbi:MAG: S8 family serine peptidase, partial [Candidatus Bathyarchaeota archaeon]
GPEMYTILNPGGANVAITVGASTKSDQVADFSSTGPTDDYEIKPDLVAPGKDIVAARASGTSMGTPVSQYYTQASGTSMATPHVAGAVALLLDVHPSWTPEQIKNVLTNYAWNIGSNVLRRGTGRLRICESVTAAVVGNSSISFGAVKVGTVYNHTLSFENLTPRAISVALSVETWHITDGTRYSSVALSVSDLYLMPMTVQTIEVSLNVGASLPPGYFEGKIAATFEATNIRIPFLFCLIAQISADVVDLSGSKLMAAFSLIDANSGQMKSYSGECQQADFTVLQGTYIVQAMNVYSWRVDGGFDATIAFVVHEEFTVGIDDTMNLRFSLASAHRISIRTTDTANNPLYLTQKRLVTPFYSMSYFSEIGVLNTQDIYVTDLSQYMQTPSYFGFAGLSADDVHWADAGILTSEVDAYFIGWDLSQIGNPTFPPALDYLNSELATFEIENLMPKSTTVSTIWFNQLADIWQTGLWPGVRTYPGITWKAHILPYQYKQNPSASWAMLEWSCMYATSTTPEESPEVYVIDRHFQPITKGENATYQVGKTPLLPQAVSDNAPYYGSGSYIPYYPLLVDRSVFLVKTDLQAQKNVEISKDGALLSNNSRPWNQEAVDISQTLQAHGYGVYSFRVSTETSLNLSTRNTARYIINYTSSNADYISPRIERIDCAPCFTENPFNIILRFTDDSTLRSASLSYSFDNSPLVQATLTDEGGGFYEANIAVPPSARSLSLLVEA